MSIFRPDSSNNPMGVNINSSTNSPTVDGKSMVRQLGAGSSTGGLNGVGSWRSTPSSAGLNGVGLRGVVGPLGAAPSSLGTNVVTHRATATVPSERHSNGSQLHPNPSLPNRGAAHSPYANSPQPADSSQHSYSQYPMNPSAPPANTMLSTGTPSSTGASAEALQQEPAQIQAQLQAQGQLQQQENHEIVRDIAPHLQMHVDRSWLQTMQARAERNGPWDDWTLFQLAYEAMESRVVRSFDELLCLKHLQQVEPMPHQLDTARRVLTEMRGRAILADEVGLGKTIEAGLILKEYMIRGLVKKVLILVPASLVLQWVRELNSKFGIAAVAQKKAYVWESSDVVVASMDTAKRDPHRDIVLNMEYDMLIIDEAHKLKNKKTTNYQFVSELRKKYCLLLTATPVQNDMKELYNLINVLKPGQLGGQGRFQASFVRGKRTPKNEDQLQEELSKIMIRNRRSDGGVAFTKRRVKNLILDLSPEEMELYRGVTDFVRERYHESQGDLASMLSLVTLQREVCSSRDAVFLTLFNMFKKLPEDSPVRTRIGELVKLIKSIKANTKAEKAMQLVEEIGEKVIIFTEYRASQEYLLHYLKERKIIAVPYRGGMNRGKKDWMMDLFKSRAQVLVATEAGGEGINLQFCHHMINFDLPWNPMRVEQRIGRVHRLGQTHDVQIYNMSTKGTVEEHILNLLHEKINMFEMVIGGLDAILEQLEKKSASLESRLLRLSLESRDENELRSRMEELSQEFHTVRQEVEQSTIRIPGLNGQSEVRG